VTALILPGVAALFVLIRTTWLSGFTIAGAQPDIALLVILFYANRSGIQRGQIAGFSVGLLQDALSISPIGFHAVLGLVSGVIAGSTRESFRTDSILAPPMLAAVVIAVRFVFTLFLSVPAGDPELRSSLFSLSYLIESGMTIVIAPIVFAILQPIHARLARRNAYR
jgi:rod shape-determining protein MreD